MGPDGAPDPIIYSTWPTPAQEPPVLPGQESPPPRFAAAAAGAAEPRPPQSRRRSGQDCSPRRAEAIRTLGAANDPPEGDDRFWPIFAPRGGSNSHQTQFPFGVWTSHITPLTLTFGGENTKNVS